MNYDNIPQNVRERFDGRVFAASGAIYHAALFVLSSHYRQTYCYCHNVYRLERSASYVRSPRGYWCDYVQMSRDPGPERYRDCYNALYTRIYLFIYIIYFSECILCLFEKITGPAEQRLCGGQMYRYTRIAIITLDLT